jgi:hypothetical protein
MYGWTTEPGIVPLSCKNSDACQVSTLVDPCRLSVVVTGITFPFPLFTYNLRSFEESDKKNPPPRRTRIQRDRQAYSTHSSWPKGIEMKKIKKLEVTQ